MRIIVGRDYYDIGLAHGRDDDITLVRERDRRMTDEEASALGFRQGIIGFRITGARNANGRISFGSTSFTHEHIEFNYCPIVAYVAGNRYQGLCMQGTGQYGRVPSWGHGAKTWLFWDAATFDAWLLERELGAESWHSWRYIAAGTSTSKTPVEDYFAVEPSATAVQDWMMENRIAVVTYNQKPNESPYDFTNGRHEKRKVWRVNGDDLKELEFYRAVDPYTAFQEISMWVGNFTQPGHEMVELDDKMRIHKHGFDKFSFRKPKQKG